MIHFFAHDLPFISRRQGPAVLRRTGSWLSGDRRKKKLCRDPERCPEMQLNRHRTHASTTTITTSESSSSSSSRSEGEGEEKLKKAGEGVALSAAETLHHRLPLWKGWRGVDGGREVLLVAALSLSPLSSFTATRIPNLLFMM